MTEDIKDIYCKLCNYKTTRTNDWMKHINSQKHIRNGEKKTTKCDLCNYESNTHWNIKAHKLKIHATSEERSKHKYYCKLCDIIFFCKAYQDKQLPERTFTKSQWACKGCPVKNTCWKDMKNEDGEIYIEPLVLPK